jgi:hypothetical protein
MRLPSGGSVQNAPAVMYVDGTTNNHVNHGLFWDGFSALTAHMFWEAWVRLVSSEGYIVSDGYGGSHALLWGANGGNIYNGSTSYSFGGDDGGGFVWHHDAVAMGRDTAGNTWVLRFINGICDGRAAFTGTRTTVSAGGGGRTLFVGGSDHSNGHFYISQLRGFDKSNPYSNNANGHACKAFWPQRHFGPEMREMQPDFLADYTHQGLVIPDLSYGYDGGSGAGTRRMHAGRLGGSYLYTPNEMGGVFTLPRWVLDPTAPFDYQGTITAKARGFTPDAVPGGARVFDSFQRDDSIPAWTASPSLGSTEGGSLGVLAWQYSGYDQASYKWPNGWGIFNGRAVRLQGQPGIAYVDNGSATQDVRVTRRKGTWSTGEVGIALRVGDGFNNHIYVTYLVDSNVVTAGRYTAGAQTGYWNATPPNTTWTKLRATASGNTISVYIDDGGAGWTLLNTQTESTHNTNTKCGLFYSSPSFAAGDDGWSSLARWDDFTVL